MSVQRGNRGGRTTKLVSRLAIGASLVLPGLAFLVVTATPAAASTTTITTVGQTAYSIPLGTTSLAVTVVGAESASNGFAGSRGQGADVQATIVPANGTTTLYVEVGAVGGGGYSDFGQSGGAASDIQTCSVSAGGCTDTGDPSTDPRLVVAGGGGGGGEDSFGAGTGGNGGNAGTSSAVTGPGAGGNGSTSGNGASGNNAGLANSASTATVGSGSSNCGGAGAGSLGSASPGGPGGVCDGHDDSDGGGGGGGWIGGSGGGAGDGNGGGGSGGGGGAGASYVESSATSVSVSSVSTAAEVIITPTIVDTAPSITSADNTSFTAGTAGTFTVTTTGVPLPTLSDGSPTLPSGVTFVDNGDGTATLAGTPASGTGGSYPFTITASNGQTPDATQSFTLTVNQAPHITSGSSTTFTSGTDGSFTVTTTGYPTGPTLTISDGGATLPNGVSFTDNGNGTATLTGTPAVGTGGTYPFTITASNGIGTNATQSFTLTVHDAPQITSADSTTFPVGTNGSFTVTTTGYPTGPTLTLSDGGATLPSGVSFTDNGDGTATITGTPASGTDGNYPFTITAANGIGTDATQTFTLTVGDGPAITSSFIAKFKVGAAATFSITTSGFPAPSISDGAATLPNGLSFTDNGDGTATIAGTPAANTEGEVVVHLTASNGVGTDATQSLDLEVGIAPVVTSANHTTFTVGTAGTFTVTGTGYPGDPDYNFDDGGGQLPSGVTFVDNHDMTATLAGTPALGTGGTYSIDITAHNGTVPNAVQHFTLSVDEPPAITSADSAQFQAGVASSFPVTVSGFPTPSISDGGATLPPGMSFSDQGNGIALLEGTPTTGGTYPFTITASNSVGSDATQSFTLDVSAAPAFTSASSVTFTVGTAGNFTVTAVGDPSGSGIVISDGGATLPAGVTFVDNGDGTGTLSGTPTATGSFPVTLTASNGVTPDATQNFVLTVETARVPHSGYLLAGSDGGVFAYGGATFYGSMSGRPLDHPIVGIASIPGGGGYWLTSSDGGVFAFGDAKYYGSMAGRHLNEPIDGITSTPNGKGYWLVAKDGGVFAFGDAAFYGSMGAGHVDAPVVGIAGTSDGGGYVLAGSDGGVFAYGDAVYRGSMKGRDLDSAIVGVSTDPVGSGYWLVASDGAIYSFGAGFMGAATGHSGVVGMVADPSGGGYWIVGSDGGVYQEGDSTNLGSPTGMTLGGNIVGVTSI